MVGIKDFKCWNCMSPMIWVGDHSYEDCGLDGDGIVSNFSCNNCEGTAEFFMPNEEEERNEDGWHKLADVKPKYNAHYLIKTSRGEYEVVFMFQDSRGYWSIESDCRGDIVYWRDLPEGPKE